jgi:ribosome maturation factor RimP
VDGANFYIAPLIDASDSDIALEVKGERLDIPLRFVSQANLEYEF